MVNVVKDKLPDIVQVCKEMNVQSLYLFGSGAREEDFTSKSDLDFLYTSLKDKEGLSLPPFDYFDLLFKLEEITGKKVDLVAKEKIKNRFFLQEVNKEMIKVYG